MSAQIMMAFMLFAVSISIVPGAGNIALLGLSSRHGFSATIPFMFGCVVGVIILLVGSSVGLVGLFSLYPELYTVMKWLGAAYLLYMAWGIANSTLETNSTVKKSGFASGVLVQILNPKSWVASLTVFSQFISPNESYLIQAVIIISGMVITGVIGMAMWAYFGTMLNQLIQSPKKLAIINRCFGGCLAMIALFVVSQPSVI
jgi:threonine/homoserine/homoserine lactone efflux protein